MNVPKLRPCRTLRYYSRVRSKIFVTFFVTFITFSIPQSTEARVGWFEYLKEGVINGACSLRDECCRKPSIRIDTAVSDLRKTLKKDFFGQHIAVETTLTALDGHLRDEHPKKPLVLSFHGWAGSGKTFLAELIAKALYAKGLESKYVKIYTASYHFPDETKVKQYKDKIQTEIKNMISDCPRSLIIFDEVDVTPETLFDSLVAFMDHLNSVGDGIDHKKAIYIFLSNIGSNEVTATSLQAWRDGRRREDLTFHDFENAVSKEAFNAKRSGMSKTRIIERVLVDYFIPFLPMERPHIIDCVKAEMRRWDADVDPEEVADALTYWPSDLQKYSQTGCKRVEGLVKYYVSKKRFSKTEL